MWLTDKSQIPLRCPACDQLANWLRPARELVAEQDSVKEYGLNRSTTRFELSRHVRDRSETRSATSSATWIA